MATESLLDLARALVVSLQGTPGQALDRATALVDLLEKPDDGQDYFTYMTPAGSAEFVSAMAESRPVDFSHLAVGDGGGSFVVPYDGMAGLVNEVHRVAISSLTPHPDNPAWLIIEAILPVDIGGFTIREIAAIGGAGQDVVMAVGNFPVTFKPLPDKNAGRDIVIEMIVYVGNAANVRLIVDPSVSSATNQSVANAISAHKLEVNPHPQYALIAELQTLLGDYARAADLVQHMLASDPHPIYMTQPKTEALLNPAISSVVEKVNRGLAILQFEQGAY